MGGSCSASALFRQVAALRQVLDAGEDGRPLHVEKHLVAVGEQLPRRVAAAGRKATKGVRQGVGQAGQVVEGHAPAVARRNHQVAVVAGAARRAARFRSIRSRHAGDGGFCGPRFAVQTSSG